MSTPEQPGGDDPFGGPGGRQPTEEEIRAAMDAQMAQVTVQDMLLQSVASLINLAARRMLKADERDLDQAKLGIDAVDAVAGLIEGPAEAEVRNAIAEIKMIYAQAAAGKLPEQPGDEGQAGAPGDGSAAGEAPAQTPPQQPPAAQPGSQGQSPKPGDEGPKLWTPHQRD